MASLYSHDLDFSLSTLAVLCCAVLCCAVLCCALPAVVKQEQEGQRDERTRCRLGTLQPLLSVSSLQGSQQGPSLVAQLLFSWARPIIDASPSTDVEKHVADELTMALPKSLSAALQAELLEQRHRAVTLQPPAAVP